MFSIDRSSQATPLWSLSWVWIFESEVDSIPFVMSMGSDWSEISCSLGHGFCLVFLLIQLYFWDRDRPWIGNRGIPACWPGFVDKLRTRTGLDRVSLVHEVLCVSGVLHATCRSVPPISRSGRRHERLYPGQHLGHAQVTWWHVQ